MNYNFAAAAAELGVSEAWLRKHSPEMPKLKFGRSVVFTDEHLAEIRARFEYEPATPAVSPLYDLTPISRRRTTEIPTVIRRHAS